MINVCVVEDDPLAAELLADYISSDEMRLVAHYVSAEDAIERIPTLPLPDVVLMDVGLPGASGIEATEVLMERFPELEVVMLTTFEDTATIVRAIKAGASGYLLKASSSAQIQHAIKEVCRGGSTLSGSVARKLLGEFKGGSAEADVARESKIEGLTEREQTILDRLVTGDSYKAIAYDLEISVHTVNNHIRHIYRKLHVNSRAQAVALATGVTS